MKEWTCTWNGLPITVQNWMHRLRSHEELVLDGDVVDRNSCYFRDWAYLTTLISVSGKQHRIEAFIGQGEVGFLVARCHILVDGVLVGGDVCTRLVGVDPKAWEETRHRGILKHALICAVLGALSFSAFETFMHWTDLTWSSPLMFAVGGGLIGVMNGLLYWYGKDAAFRSRKEKLANTPTFTIPGERLSNPGQS